MAAATRTAATRTAATRTAATRTGSTRTGSTPPAATHRGVWETVSLMEYVILIVVIAVLAVVTGGWLLLVRPRRGRGTIAPPSPPRTVPTASPPGGATEPAKAKADAKADAEANAAAATAATGVLDLERPPPSAGRMVRLRARLARSQSSVGSALLSLLSRDRLDDETWDEIEEVLITADVGVAPARIMVDDLRTKVKVLGARGPAEVRAL
ncbi:MAG: signal recognition particle receptor subunit alpha, partial [Streptosporangiaceae bacterium]